ncbi:MAG TPA: hypothetical protein VGB56_01280 [Flavisolibacter sp.]|jgi:hypothetical protein
MERNRNNRGPEEPRDTSNNVERKSTIPNDLPDSPQDQERLQGEETVINLPDVKDIPGQEFVNAPPLGAMADTTISSDDEEGASVFNRDDSEDLTEDTSFDVRNDERQALADTEYLPTTDEDNLRTARMDNADFDNEPLNEKGFGEELSGSDLDMDTGPDETNTDSLGQGDEENKHYSLGSSENDNVTEGTP